MTTEESRKKQTEAAELDTLRAEIDRLDQEVVERIHARSKVAMAIGEVKALRQPRVPAPRSRSIHAAPGGRAR